ncbi:MAG: transcriptional repressor, partial [Micrococcales bacterium]
AQQLHARMRAGGARIGLATVYRGLQALVHAGAVDVLRIEDNEARYRLCATSEHHHHLVCRGCGRVEEIAEASIEHWAAAEAARFGFTDVSHTVEVMGLCPQCRAEGCDRAGPPSGRTSR